MPRPLALAALTTLAASSCSLIEGTGFDECFKDSDCRAGATLVACVKRYCLPMPAGCFRAYGAPDNPDRIALGAALPLTVGGALDGGVDDSEVQVLNAGILALDEANQRDGVDGRPFALYTCNTGGDRERLKAQVAWMAEQLHAPAALTSGSDQTLAAATVTVPREMLLMTATSTSPEVSSRPASSDGGTRLLWRTAPSDAIQGRVIADHLKTDPGFSSVTRVGVVYVDDPYGQGLKEVLVSNYTGGGRVVRTFPFARGGEVASTVTSLTTFVPQVTVLIAFSEDAVRVLLEARQKANLAPTAGHRWFFTDSAKAPELLAGPQVANILNAFGTAPAQGAGQAFSSFRDRFIARFGKDPSDFSFTSHGYDAVYLLALSAAYAGGADGLGPITGARMAEGLTKVSSGPAFRLTPDQLTPAKAALQAGTAIDVEGASGRLNFDAATGEATSPIELWQVSADGGGFQTVRTIDPPAL